MESDTINVAPLMGYTGKIKSIFSFLEACFSRILNGISKMASAADLEVIPMKVLSHDIQVVYTGAALQHIYSITYTLSLLWQLSKSL